MAARRGSGKRPGSVTPKKGRDLFEARVTLSDGSRPSRYFTREKDAWVWVNQMLASDSRGETIVESSSLTGKFLEEWLETVAIRNVRGNTLYNYRLMVGYVQEWIGGIKLRDLKRQHIERTFAGLEKRGLARSTQAYCHRVLKQSLEYAVDCNLLIRNPMHRMKPPRVLDERDRVLSLDEVRAILQEAHGTRFWAVYWILATTGMRISECMGLEWKNIDLDSGYVLIEHQALQSREKGGVHLEPLKTAKSRREAVLPPFVCDILRQCRVRQDAEREQARARGVVWPDHGTVFTTINGKLVGRNTVGGYWRDIRYRLGLDDEVTLHTFRHTVSTMLQERGHTLKAAQKLLGHSSERMTNRVYTHADRSVLEGIASTMTTLLAPDVIDAEFNEADDEKH